MKTQMKTFAMMVGLLAMSAMMALAQGGHGGPGNNGNSTRDPLSGLKRAITKAEAPALTATQETALTALITAYRDAVVDASEDTALQTARDAYDAAIAAGNQTAANTAADQIAARHSVISAANLKLAAKLAIDVLSNLRAGGQLAALITEFGAEKVADIARSLGGHGGGPGGRN